VLDVDAAKSDSTVVIDGYPYETPDTPWRVREVKACDGYELRVTFRDGLIGTVSMKDRVHRSDAGVFRSLSDPATFANVSVIFGVVTWANGVDLAPDAMHDQIKRNGVWVLR
jgi:hypothetical protein